MTNVLYPIIDLINAYVQLINGLTPTDWNKITYFKNKKVSAIALDLFRNKYELLKDYCQHNFSIDLYDDKLNDLEKFKVLMPELDLMIENAENLRSANFPKEYGQLWLKQQHIRQAVYQQHLIQKHFYFPFLNYNMLALAKHYEFIQANLNTVVKVEIVGNAGGVWTIKKTVNGWDFIDMEEKTPNALIYIDQQIAWLLLTGGVDLTEANQYYQIIGDRSLGSHVLKINFNS